MVTAMVGRNDRDGSVFVWESATPEIVEHVAARVQRLKSSSTSPPDDGSRGELIAEARKLAAGPQHEDRTSQGGAGSADYWMRARWLAKWAMSGIETDDAVVVALRRMTI